MAFLKHNRLWKPTADLFLRAKSSIKTISRNQSILTSTSKFLLDRDKGNRDRRIFGHSTNFFGNGPVHYRYYSDVDREKRRIEEELNRCLTSLENNEPYNNIRVLLRAPYYCSKYKCERRFLPVFDRWWSRMKSVENNKPTSTIFHLGALNKNDDGIIIKKLSKIDRLKSLESLVAEAAAVNFCSLRDRHDVLSFLNGIRDLAMDAKFTKVLYPSLIPSRTELFKNIDKYLREKETVRKRHHHQNPSVHSDWEFMITKEAPAIFTCLAFNFRISYSDINDFERDVLKRLCGLIKKGYDYSVETSTIDDDVSSFGIDYSNFAYAWLLWNVDPDKLVRGIWRSWFSVYRIYSQRIGSNDESNNVRRFMRCKTLLGVCERFRKVDCIHPVFDIWLDDVRKLSPSVARLDPKQGEFGDVAVSFTEFIYSAGQCWKYFALDKQRDLKPIFWLVAMDALEAFKGKPVNSVAINRYLTGIRDFRSAISKSSASNILYPTHFGDELLKYLNERMDHELSKTITREALLENSARIIILLSRSKMEINAELWSKLLTPLCGNNSRTVFDGNEQKLGFIVASFGEAMCDYSSAFDKFCPLQVPNDVFITGYFELAGRFMENVDPSQAAVEIDKTHYAFTLSVVSNVAQRFNAIEEFKKVKQIWERRITVLVNRVSSRSAALMAQRIGQWSKFDGVRFDPVLEEKLRRRGEEFERKRKSSR